MENQERTLEEELNKIRHYFTILSKYGKLIPLKEDSKQPTKKGKNWSKEEYEGLDINAAVGHTFFMGENIGLRLDNLVVIDVEREHDREILKNLINKFDEMTKCLRQETANGGTHFIFSSPTKNLNCRLIKPYPGIDFFAGKDSYIVIYPSKIKEGKYVFKGGDEIIQAPQDLVDYFLNKKFKKEEEGGKEEMVEDRKFKNLRANMIMKDILKTYKERKIDEGERNVKLTSIAGKLRLVGLNANELKYYLSKINSECCQPPLDQKEIESISNSIGNKEPDEEIKKLAEKKLSKKEEREKILEEGLDMLLEAYNDTTENYYVLIKDEDLLDFIKSKAKEEEFSTHKINDKIFYHLNDPFIKYLKCFFKESMEVRFSYDEIYEAIKLKTGFSETINWITYGKPVWDGVPRLDSWLPEVWGINKEEDNIKYKIASKLGRFIMIAIVSRQLWNDSKNKNMLMVHTLPILHGPQGIGKSMFCKLLAEKSGKPKSYTALTKNLKDKDSLLKLESNVIIELDEMEAVRKISDCTEIKSVLTTEHLTIRKPYARNVTNIYVRSIMIGTTNSKDIPPDPTGYRRFAILELSKDNVLNVEKMENMLPQLYAEAIYRVEEEGELPIYKRDEDDERLARQYTRENVYTGLFEEVFSYIDDKLILLKYEDKELMEGFGLINKCTNGDILKAIQPLDMEYEENRYRDSEGRNVRCLLIGKKEVMERVKKEIREGIQKKKRNFNFDALNYLTKLIIFNIAEKAGKEIRKNNEIGISKKDRYQEQLEEEILKMISTNEDIEIKNLLQKKIRHLVKNENYNLIQKIILGDYDINEEVKHEDN